MRRARCLAVGAVLCAPLWALVAAPATAEAFSGFYVSGAEAKLYSDATVVVMMREGTRTVLSMQNHYQGPPESFAMVVPVPVVLNEENVKTLPREIFARVDSLAAPRLVESWEQDPCRRSEAAGEDGRTGQDGAEPTPRASGGVKVEAQFTAGEYEVMILSASESAGLVAWLKDQRYALPANAAPLLAPYVELGSKFFVAKVDPRKVTMKDGQAMLSPLRFHYDEDELRLPLRLGLASSQGTQDLIVHILARGKRYAVANYPNVTIPTNLDVKDEARERFGELYAALFDKTLEKHEGAVVTEYAWEASSCDPCPVPALAPNELATLGLDVLVDAPGDRRCDPGDPMCDEPSAPALSPNGFVLTRLHARYAKESLGDDLVFEEAPAIVGGREVRGADGALERGAQQGGQLNGFQARYVIRHPWTGAKDCKDPRFGVWGGPPNGKPPVAKPALDLAFVKRGGVKLGSMLVSDVPELDIHPAAETPAPKKKPSPSPEPETPVAPRSAEGCGCELGPPRAARSSWLAAGALLGLALRRLALRRRAKE